MIFGPNYKPQFLDYFLDVIVFFLLPAKYAYNDIDPFWLADDLVYHFFYFVILAYALPYNWKYITHFPFAFYGLNWSFKKIKGKVLKYGK